VPSVALKEAPGVAPSSDLAIRLKQWRRDKAKERNVAAYVVMSDATLLDLCRKMPRNRYELTGVAGIGERKADLYGEDLLALLGAP
jgi:superfamily II DNA helicase RecQ